MKDCRANNKRKMAVLLSSKNLSKLHIDQPYIRGVTTEKSLISRNGKTLMKRASEGLTGFLRENVFLKYPGLK